MDSRGISGKSRREAIATAGTETRIEDRSSLHVLATADRWEKRSLGFFSRERASFLPGSCIKWAGFVRNAEVAGSGNAAFVQRSLHRMPAEHGGEVAEFVVDVLRIGDGLGNGVADRLAPGFAEAVELGSHGIVRAATLEGDFLQ